MSKKLTSKKYIESFICGSLEFAYSSLEKIKKRTNEFKFMNQEKLTRFEVGDIFTSADRSLAYQITTFNFGYKMGFGYVPRFFLIVADMIDTDIWFEQDFDIIRNNKPYIDRKELVKHLDIAIEKAEKFFEERWPK